MQPIIDWLQGKKSYIVLILGFIFNLGQLIGWWTADNQMWAALNTILVTLLGISFRAAITKSGPQS
jgi:hypothetical protein